MCKAKISKAILLMIVAFGNPAVFAQTKVEAETATLKKEFVPNGWSIEAEVKGDLNGDKLDDLILMLIDKRKQVNPAAEEGLRMLVVLFRTSGGSFEQGALNKTLLRCFQCFGAMGGKPVISIKKGVLIVDQLVGSRETTNGIWRFRFDTKELKMRLIGLDVRKTDRVEGTSTLESTNYLTGKRIIESFRYDEKQQRDMLVSSRTVSVPADRIFLEETDSKNLD